MKTKLSRRNFIKSGVGAGTAALLSRGGLKLHAQNQESRYIAVSSQNGMSATEKAMRLMKEGTNPLDAAIAGVNMVENDPEDISVGYGGLPNEAGVVELDASVMHGPTHNAGAVAGLRNIKNPSLVAKLVMERTGHALLAGKGALEFARAHGFKEENLLTENSRRIWLRRKEQLSDQDYWYPPKSEELDEDIRPAVESHGTINCCALNAAGDLAGVTTTSGFFFKIPGRVGDSPIIGAGLYVDNDAGAAGSTGLGEANILTCGSHMVVEFMKDGHSPEEACLRALKRVAGKARFWPERLDEQGRPRFQLNYYAVNKRGEYAGASMWSGRRFAVHDGTANRLEDSAYLFKREKS
ncbi:MAG: N(4)-(beta-N-acetylglucosaminyl)-L-asparaginase [Candidatus Aminicenantaceae bacterium]